jgi:DNA-binding MarR family transcriptional regulator
MLSVKHRGARLRRSSSGRPAPAAKPRFVLENHFYYLLSQIVGRRNRRIAQKLRPFGVTMPKWRVLAVLHERPTATMTQLADFTTIDRTTLTRTLDQMVRDRLVQRRVDEHDRRSIRIHLTPKGARVFDRILPLVIEENDYSARGISPETFADFRRTLGRIVANLDPDHEARNSPWLQPPVSRATGVITRALGRTN